MTDEELVLWLRTAPSNEWCGPMLEKAASAIERLRRGVQDMLEGDYPNPRKHRHKLARGCPHGTVYFECCEQCNDEWLIGILNGDN